MNKNPELHKPVTVLMPAYNAARTLEASVRSVMAQTYRNWDLLIVDDGSTDATAEICQRLAQEDSRVIHYRSAHIGFSAVLNLGLSLIQGRYVARLDADDLSHPERLQKQVDFLTAHPEVKVLGTWGERINDQGRHLSELQLGAPSVQAFEEFQKQRKPLFLIHSSVLAERETLVAFGGFQKEEYPSDDIWLWTRIAQQHPVLALPENLVGYRISPGGISNQTLWKMILQWARCEYNLNHEQKLSAEDFEKQIRSNPLVHLKYRCGYLHKFLFRTGAYYFYNGQKPLGSLYLAGGAMFSPIHTLRRVVGSH